MSAFRRRWRVVVDGRTYEVRTTARDMAALDIQMDDDGNPTLNPTQVMRMVHAALIRTKAEDIPADVDAFLDLLDDMDDLEDIGAVAVVDPTPAAPSVT